MKTMKKAFALILSLVMVLALGTTAFAAETDGTITISNPQAGETYSIYRIFDLELSESENPYRYTVNSAWKDFFVGDAPGADYVTIAADGHVTWKTDKDATTGSADVNAFAAAAKDWAKDRNVTAVASKACGTTDTQVKFENLQLGYYLIDSATSTLVALGTTDKDAIIKEKSALPNIDKEVAEDSATSENNKWGDSNTADIGQNVDFKVTITAETGATGYVLHDTMSDGLDYTGVSKVTWTHKNAAGTTVTDELTLNTDYTVVTPGTEEATNDRCTFEVHFDKDFLEKVVNNDEIIVYYSATVTEYAVIGGTGNKNEAKLEYGDDNEKKDETITKTFELNIWKFYTDSDGDENALKGADFILYKGSGDNIQYATFDEDGKFASWVTDKEAAITLTSGEDGFIHVEGLDADTYFLLETKAPDGYNLLDGAVTITIDKDGNVTNSVSVGEDDDAIDAIKVENDNGTKLPETGGIGTTIFYIVGGLLMVGAVVLLVTKKKMSVQD